MVRAGEYRPQRDLWAGALHDLDIDRDEAVAGVELLQRETAS
jgi:hypothetical protein